MFRNQDRFFKDTTPTTNNRTILWKGKTTNEEIQKILKLFRRESFQELSSKIKYRDDLIFELQSCLSEIKNERDDLRHKYETSNKE